MSDFTPKQGTVYTETVVFSPPQQYAADAPYQIAIIEYPDGIRSTVRIIGREPDERAVIGDTVVFAEEKDGVEYYRKSKKPA